MRYLIWIPSGLLGVFLMIGGLASDRMVFFILGALLFIGGGILGVMLDERRKARQK